LLPYFCQFAEIELTWANIEGRVAKQNTIFMLNEVKSLQSKQLRKLYKQKKLLFHTWTDTLFEDAIDLIW
jgi:hypothetical protein